MVSYLSVCSGIESASVAWEPLGWVPLAFSEIDPFASAVLAHHFPNVPNWGDMRNYDNWPDATPDVLVGGTPCQAFSLAGLRQGFTDPRGNLTRTFLHVVQRYRPEWVVWENVPGVLSSDGGRNFGTLLGGLEKLGYRWAYRTLDAQYFGIPQRRRRVYLVGYCGTRANPESVLFESSRTRRDAPTLTPENATELARNSFSQLAEGGRWWDGRHISQTLDAVLYKRQVMPEKNRFPAVRAPQWAPCACCDDYWCHAHGMHVFECLCPGIDTWTAEGIWPYDPVMFRFLTPVECERLQGFPDGYTAIPYRNKPAADGPRYRALGNAMPVPVMRWIGSRLQTCYV